MDFIKDFNIDKVRNLAEDVYNQHKPKTDLEAKIYEVLSHKNWGSSSTLLNELAQDTYDYDKFPVIIKLMWEGMNNRPAAWRVVFKSLTLLEHLVKNGSERCVDDAQGHKHFLKGLHNFNYYEGTVDRGIGVREKSKQIVELLSDDERVREERQKAKQLREKFGGSMRGVSSEGGSSGGGYGGDFSSSSSSGRYAGYGKDSMQSGGGYGNSGIGSHSSYNDNSSSADRGYSGRYSDTTSSNVTPTFATLPEQGESSKEPSSKPKKLKKKKKKDKTSQAVAPVAPAPAAPAVDLFSFDDNSPAPAAAAAEDDFGAFDSAPNTKTSASADVDPFGDFSSSSSPAQPAISNTTAAPVAFDAFSSESKPAAVTAFDAFGTSGNSSSTSNNDPFATNNTTSAPSMMSPMNNMSSMNSSSGMGMMNMGMNSMGGGMSSPNSNIMGGGSSQQKPPVATAAEEDDFGDFAEADNKKKGDDVLSNDPYSKLIGLDGLKKNIKKGDKANEPILFNANAKTAFDMNQKQNKNEMMPTMDPALSFSGIDGLQKQLDVSHNRSNISNRQPGQPVMMSNTGGVAGGMNSLNSGMAAMSMGGGMNQQSMMGGNNMGNMGMSNNNMMGGSGMGMSMNSMQQQQSMMGGMMGGGMNMGMNNNNNMMGGNMNGMNGMGMGSMSMGGMNQNQQQSSNNNMMGGGMGTTMGTMGNQTMGGGQAGSGQMGGMPMDGWR
eukprot:CAMPEP_0178972448 /NCGR_PEP_ID=MMETSP0789-20121207/21023_1 /TAXON_ID=3005 /ORGANISM="Rhizosolenia setigera, Strain CCMP 1694" /LENGTH=716 /DNA_ID=CAMNT_0020659905 /DNA_START=73 /DNA_END=2223 /DNA_ORIENTATION=-